MTGQQRLRLEPRGSDANCPLCKGPIAGEETRRCSGCGTLSHEACAREMGGCSTLGCDKAGQEVVRRSASAAERVPAVRDVLDPEAHDSLGVTLLVGVIWLVVQSPPTLLLSLDAFEGFRAWLDRAGYAASWLFLVLAFGWIFVGSTLVARRMALALLSWWHGSHTPSPAGKS